MSQPICETTGHPILSSLADWWVNGHVKRLRTHLKEDQ